jgi:diguanylate cyclase (GGDEF)-like protein/PAS domain S-box-containing protein
MDPGRTWDLDALRAHVAGREVFARSTDLDHLALPEVLHGAALAPSPVAWTERISVVHPEDRPLAVQAWFDALDDPGAMVSTVLRYREGEDWSPRRLDVCDLTHQAAVGAVLFVIGPTDADPTAPTGPDRAGTGTAASAAQAVWDAPAWVLQRLDGMGNIVHVEGRVREVFGVPAEELIGTNISTRIHPGDRAVSMSMWLDVVADPGETRTTRQRVVRPDGSWSWIDSTVMNRLEAGGPTGGVMLVMSHDVTGRLQEEAALRASQAEFRTLAEEVPVAVFRADRDGTITYANSRWHHLVGDAAPTRLEDLAAPGEARRLGEQVRAALASDAPEHGAVELTARDGRRRFALAYRRVQASGAPETLVGVLHDITETVELRRRAEHDELTGLLNRRGLEDRIADHLEAGRDPVVVLIDLDGFKEINDRFGHDAGDEVLGVLGRRLAARLPPPVAVARWGGDEFVAVAPQRPDAVTADPAGIDVGRELVAGVDDALAEPVGSGERVWHPAASMGVAVGGPDDEPADLLRRADQAMYAEKRRRRSARTAPSDQASG